MTPEQRARGLALALRQELGLGHGRVDPVAVLREHRGVEVIQLPAGDLDGMYHRQDGVGVVLINSERPAIRQRFTAAHELGHDVIDGANAEAVAVVDLDIFQAAGHDKLMNYFAGAFLVDPHGVRELRAAGLEGLDLVAQVVATFEVSVQAAAVELRKLGEIDQQACDVATAAGLTTNKFMRDRGIRFEVPEPELTPVDPERRRRVLAAFRAGLLTVDGAAGFLHMSPEETVFWLDQAGAVAPAPTDPLLLAEEDPSEEAEDPAMLAAASQLAAERRL